MRRCGGRLVLAIGLLLGAAASAAGAGLREGMEVLSSRERLMKRRNPHGAEKS